MKITLFDINRAGLDSDVIIKYQKTPYTTRMIRDIALLIYRPAPLKVYPQINGKYTVADGINRLCSHLYLGRLEFDVEIIQ